MKKKMSIIMIRTFQVGKPNFLESQTQKKNKLSLNWEDAYTFKTAHKQQLARHDNACKVKTHVN